MVSARRIARSPITWTVAVLLVVALGAGLAVFQPWRLFTDTTSPSSHPVSASSVPTQRT